MSRTFKILEEGVVDNNGRLFLLGSVRWEKDTLPVFRGFDDFGNQAGTITNLRREDGWVVGDLSFDLDQPDLFVGGGYVNNVESDVEHGYFRMIDCVLQYVAILPNPAYPERTER